MQPDRHVIDYYAGYAEEDRLAAGPGRLEHARTQVLLQRLLGPAPRAVLDVGGAAGAHAFPLAAQGHAVSLVDLSPRLAAEAGRRSATAAAPLRQVACADARRLPFADASFDAVLLMGPLYHLQRRDDRLQALAEARRVLRPGGCIAAAAISRYAAVLDGLCHHLHRQSGFEAARDRALRDGCHDNPQGLPGQFTTAYFHRPAELAEELAAAGCRGVRVFGVEGPGWLLADFDARWQSPELRQQMLAAAALLEEEPAVVGASAHLLAVGLVSTGSRPRSPAGSRRRAR